MTELKTPYEIAAGVFWYNVGLAISFFTLRNLFYFLLFIEVTVISAVVVVALVVATSAWLQRVFGKGF